MRRHDRVSFSDDVINCVRDIVDVFYRLSDTHYNFIVLRLQIYETGIQVRVFLINFTTILRNQLR